VQQKNRSYLRIRKTPRIGSTERELALEKKVVLPVEDNKRSQERGKREKSEGEGFSINQGHRISER